MENASGEVVIQELGPSSDTLQFIIVKEGKEGEIYPKGDGNEEEHSEEITHTAWLLHRDSKPRDKTFRCDVCDTEFQSMGDLQTHANTLHLNVPSTNPLPKSEIILKVSGLTLELKVRIKSFLMIVKIHKLGSILD